MDNSYLTKYVNILERYTTQKFTEEELNVSMLDLGINSFSVIEIMMVIEEKFNVNFPDSLINPDLFFSPKTLFDGLMSVIHESSEK